MTHRFDLAIALAILFTIPVVAARAPSNIVGRELEHVVMRGDTWASLGARHGIAPALLAALNGHLPNRKLVAGERIRIDNRHIVPRGLGDGLTINIPQRMLFLVSDGAVIAHYPVGVGRSATPTFIGPFTVVSKATDPIWHVPPSIQEEMRREGKTVVTLVPPGPDNPLGQHWLGLSAGGYGIHGTIAPLSIYGYQTHGCIRLHPDDVAALFDLVTVDTPGEIVYRPVLLHATETEIVLEVHADSYRRGIDMLAEIYAEAVALGVVQRIDWNAVASAVNVRDGYPRPVQVAALR